jgi:hypothetical protein
VDERQQAQDETAQARTRYDHYAQLCWQTEQALQAHRRMVSERALCHAQRAALKALAVKGVRAGYYHGVEQNFQYIFGDGDPRHRQQEAA